MIIGLDFDNTIVKYDDLFHRVALEKKLISKEIPVNKFEVRNYLRQMGKEDVWTEMQGYVYGARMEEAIAYDGAIEFLVWAKTNGHQLAIISHKTKFPFAGEKYDLHSSATKWIADNLLLDGEPLVQTENIFFLPTKELKVAKITSFDCDLFLDDLPEILTADGFSEKTKKILFDPEDKHSLPTSSSISKLTSWRQFKDYLVS